MTFLDDMLEQELEDSLDVAYAKDGVKRCAALVDHRRCRRRGHFQIRGMGFCYQHEAAWDMHYEIIDRILAIPARD